MEQKRSAFIIIIIIVLFLISACICSVTVSECSWFGDLVPIAQQLLFW